MIDRGKALALREYEGAMTEFLTSVRTRDTRSDFPKGYSSRRCNGPKSAALLMEAVPRRN